MSRSGHCLKVIGVGWSRTGTLSLKNTLESHGYDPVWHGYELFKHRHKMLPFLLKHESKLLSSHTLQAHNSNNEGVNCVNWDEFFDGYNAACDGLCFLFWKELSLFYPNSKIILTKRDNNNWLNSYQSVEHIWQPKFDMQHKIAYLNQIPRKFNPMYNEFFEILDRITVNKYNNLPGYAFDLLENKQLYLDAYDNHNDTVIDYFNSNESLKKRFFIVDLERKDQDVLRKELLTFLGVDLEKAEQDMNSQYAHEKHDDIIKKCARLFFSATKKLPFSKKDNEHEWKD